LNDVNLQVEGMGVRCTHYAHAYRQSEQDLEWKDKISKQYVFAVEGFTISSRSIDFLMPSTCFLPFSIPFARGIQVTIVDE